MKELKKTSFFFVIFLCFEACNQNDISIKKSESSEDTHLIKEEMESLESIEGLTYVYATIDSMISINEKSYYIHVDQLDYSNLSYIQNDTLPRPIYGCHFTIKNEDSKVIIMDSVFRDSWGYPGKISAIESYQISLPEIVVIDNEIQLRFQIYDYASLDAICGVYSFQTINKDIHLFWEESSIDDE